MAWIDKKNRLAHRLFYKQYRGTLDDNLTIDHLCSNRSCVNPDHLEEVPLSVNAKRARERNAQSTCAKGHIKDKMRVDHGYEYMVCSTCQREYYAEYREKNRTRTRERVNEWNRKKRAMSGTGKREYLRSLGFTVGERGRFSLEMQQALKDYEEPEVVNKPIPKVKNTPKRTDGITVYTAELHGGQIIRFDTCATCKENVVFCHCLNPQPPAWLAEDVAVYRSGE